MDASKQAIFPLQNIFDTFFPIKQTNIHSVGVIRPIPNCVGVQHSSFEKYSSFSHSVFGTALWILFFVLYVTYGRRSFSFDGYYWQDHSFSHLVKSVE